MLPKLYESLVDWWPLLSPAEEYEEEASYYRDALLSVGSGPSETLLELGSGAGSNAFYLKQRFQMTLVDLSPGMLKHSRTLNEECEHHIGDMRTVRLGRLFDRVFIHDAICYMTTIADLRSAIVTAFAHCRPGGVAVFAPDCVRETFEASTDHGGTDGNSRGLRYLEWTWDPEPSDSIYFVDYAYMLRDTDGSVSVEHDRHVEGLFGQNQWLDALSNAGFFPKATTIQHSDCDRPLPLFIGVKPE